MSPSGPLCYAGRLLLIALPMLALTYAIFSDALAPTLPSLPLTFTILPFVIWAALRFGRREVTALNALVCIIAVWHTIDGRGPYASAPLGTSLLLLLAFMGTVVSTGLVLNTVVGERGRAFEALAQTLKTLKEEAIRDPLTNLYNRRFLRDYLSRELLRAAREGIRVAVIMIDLDRFKRVNDTAGHAAGDFARPTRPSTTRKAGGATKSGFSRAEPPRFPRFAPGPPSARTHEASRRGPACTRKRMLLGFPSRPHILGPRSKGEISCNLTFI